MNDSIIVLNSDDDDDELEKNISLSTSKLIDDEDELEVDKTNKLNEKNVKSLPSKKQCREYIYEAIEENLKLETEIEKIKILSELTPKQIEYMVLRDINYYIDIFSGNCEHSWRHQEFKKFSKKSGNLLYANSAMTSYTYEQYMSAVKALQSVFCKKNHKYDEYIVKVLLPEALIKICMRVYQCSKDSAEDYLKKNNIKTSFADYPRGSAVYASNSK